MRFLDLKNPLFLVIYVGANESVPYDLLSSSSSIEPSGNIGWKNIDSVGSVRPYLGSGELLDIKNLYFLMINTFSKESVPYNITSSRF